MLIFKCIQCGLLFECDLDLQTIFATSLGNATEIIDVDKTKETAGLQEDDEEERAEEEVVAV